MSTIAEVFLGTDEEAQRHQIGSAKSRKAVSMRGLSGNDFSNLWARIQRATPDEGYALQPLLPAGEPKPLELFRFPEGFVSALAGVNNEAWVRDLAGKWFDGAGDHMIDVLEALIKRARQAQKTGQGMYLYVIE